MPDIPISSAARMDGKVVFVTGAAGGIGQAVVRVFIDAGATVVATDLGDSNPFSGQAGVHYARYDVTSEQQTDLVVARVVRELGKIDALVLCAGLIVKTPLGSSTDEEWESIWRVNVMGTVNPLRRVFPLMCNQGYGKIVALGSIAAKIGSVVAGPGYVATKAAVHGLIKWTARAGARHGVFANIIAPGPVETQMWQKVTDGAPTNAPLGRFGKPEDIAQGILFLCSSASNWITGSTLDVNGGALMA